MARYVLDADAIMVFLEDKPGAPMIEDVLRRSIDSHKPVLMSVVSWGTVFQMILKSHGEAAAESKIRELQQLSIELVTAEASTCTLAASISTKLNLQYVNCFGAAVAYQRRATLVTLNSEVKFGQGLKVLVPK
jgi:predicted nucleic acid-binding protein